MAATNTVHNKVAPECHKYGIYWGSLVYQNAHYHGKECSGDIKNALGSMRGLQDSHWQL